MPEFEFHWWMVAAVAIVVVLGLIVWWVEEFFKRHPNLKRALTIVLGAVVLFGLLGAASAALPAGTYEVCTTMPNQCLGYIIEHGTPLHR